VVLAVYSNPVMKRLITGQFHRLFYYAAHRDLTWKDTRWLGIPTLKCVFDLWVYQEIIHELRPELIIECGSGYGGSTLFFASMCDLIDHGRVVSVDDRDDLPRPDHARITYLRGSSVSGEIIDQVRALLPDSGHVLVCLDSDHAMAHVLTECRLYCEFVSPGSYLIVEDTNVNGHPVSPHFGPGPMEAVRAFLSENREFVSDGGREKFLLSFNPKGFLRRIT